MHVPTFVPTCACAHAGLAVAAPDAAEPCFSGDGAYRTDFCVKAPAARKAARGRKGGDGGGEDEGGEPPLPTAYVWGMAAALGLAWWCHSKYRGMRARQAEEERQAYWRQLRGRVD